ncbi:MAG: OmpA family protein [Burkholderiaceae bacterium]
MAAFDTDALGDAGVDGGSGLETGSTVWAVFGDLMAGLLGAFALILVCALAVQFELSNQLDAEVKRREAEAQRREALERALAGPLAAGRISLNNGRIGISGSVLFEFNSAELQPEGRQVLKSLAAPLAAYLQARDEVLMVSGFTDDRQMRHSGHRKFDDNLELSAQRALTVTRTLIDEGLPSSAVFAAAFGAEQPVASNADAEGRAKNRRVEIAPTPRPQRGQSAASAAHP